MSYDLPPEPKSSSPDTTGVDSSPDIPAPAELESAELVEQAFENRARYIDGAAQLIKRAIRDDPEPEPGSFLNDHEYQIAAAEWDARMAEALRQSAELHGRMLELEELRDELLLIKKYAAENRNR